MRQENIRNIEDYIYDFKDREIVIVGSSITARIKQHMLGPKYWNLAIQGGTSLTGLEIILKNKAAPKLVIVELNVINNFDGRLIRDIFNSILYPIRSVIPSFREKYRPTNLLLNFMRLYVVKSAKDKRETAIRDKSETETPIFHNRIEWYKRKYYKAVHSLNNIDEYKESYYWQLLIQNIRKLVRRGTDVIFLVAPTTNAKSPIDILKQNYFLSEFPDSEYLWLFYGMNDEYETSDGLHLSYNSAWNFSFELKRQVEKLF